jgi:hypothetical protein
VVVDLPLTILPHVDEGVTSFDLLTCCAHGELIDTDILTPIMPNGDVRIQNLSLSCECKEEQNRRIINTHMH